MASTNARRLADVDNAVPAWARELVAEVRSLRQAIERHVGGVGSRDDADVAVRRVLAEFGFSRSLSSKELFALQSTDAALHQAFTAALIDDPAHLGKLLSRLYKHGLVGRDVTRGPHGWRWRV